MTSNAFGYNGLDARVSKTDSSGTYGFKRNGAGVTDPVLSDGAATYTPGISERRGGNSKFLHSGMKNADAQTGSSANVDSSRTYDAFGNLTGSDGTWSGPFGYAGGFGYQEDPDHGLRLLGHRYYDSSTGRFISKDPIGDGRNWTAYSGNNPVYAVDPDGRAALVIVLAASNPIGWIIAGTAAAVVVGAIVGAAIYDKYQEHETWSRLDQSHSTTTVSAYPITAPMINPSDNPLETRRKSRKRKDDDDPISKGHRKKRPSTKDKHDKGDGRRKRDRRGGEKGDARRWYDLVPYDPRDVFRPADPQREPKQNGQSMRLYE